MFDEGETDGGWWSPTGLELPPAVVQFFLPGEFSFGKKFITFNIYVLK